jgi:hypothetical protein
VAITRKPNIGIPILKKNIDVTLNKYQRETYKIRVPMYIYRKKSCHVSYTCKITFLVKSKLLKLKG